jgi:hypothetical protein
MAILSPLLIPPIPIPFFCLAIFVVFVCFLIQDLLTLLFAFARIAYCPAPLISPNAPNHSS